MIDWTVARTVGKHIAGNDPVPDLGMDLQAFCDELQTHFHSYAGMKPQQPVPAVEILSRRQWVETMIANMQITMGPIEGKLSEKIEKKLQQKLAAEKGGQVSPLRAALTKSFASLALSSELGVLSGYLSRNVLGQYDIQLLDASAPPRLLFVGPNLIRSAELMNVSDKEGFYQWIAAHEMTHAYQFLAHPWLRDYLGTLIREYLATAEARIESDKGWMGLLGTTAPHKLLEKVKQGGLISLVQTPEQEEVFLKIGGVMSLVEGHATLVMNRYAEDHLPDAKQLEEKFNTRRKNKSAAEKLFQKIIGLDVKLRQYEEGEAFCSEVVDSQSIEFLARAFTNAESLPTMEEIRRPHQWINRMKKASDTDVSY